MEQDRDMKLKQAFPSMFRNLDYIETRDGWLNLIYRLTKKIEETCRDHGLSGEQMPYASQIKEKFGSLRYHMRGREHWTDDLMDEIVAIKKEYEDESLRTCERCGQSGSLHTSTGVWMVRCPECLAVEGEARRIETEKWLREWKTED